MMSILPTLGDVTNDPTINPKEMHEHPKKKNAVKMITTLLPWKYEKTGSSIND